MNMSSYIIIKAFQKHIFLSLPLAIRPYRPSLLVSRQDGIWCPHRPDKCIFLCQLLYYNYLVLQSVLLMPVMKQDVITYYTQLSSLSDSFSNTTFCSCIETWMFIQIKTKRINTIFKTPQIAQNRHVCLNTKYEYEFRELIISSEILVWFLCLIAYQHSLIYFMPKTSL